MKVVKIPEQNEILIFGLTEKLNFKEVDKIAKDQGLKDYSVFAGEITDGFDGRLLGYKYTLTYPGEKEISGYRFSFAPKKEQLIISGGKVELSKEQLKSLAKRFGIEDFIVREYIGGKGGNRPGDKIKGPLESGYWHYSLLYGESAKEEAEITKTAN